MTINPGLLALSSSLLYFLIGNIFHFSFLQQSAFLALQVLLVHLGRLARILQ